MGLGSHQGNNVTPGYASIGAAAAATERAPVNGSGSNGFDMNTKGLDELARKLTGIISQFETLDDKITSISGKLGGIAGGIAGGGTSTGGLITSASFSAPPGSQSSMAAAAPIAAALGRGGGSGPAQAGSPNPNTPGPGGPGNTSAGFGGIGAGTALAGIAGAGAVSGVIGKVTGALSSLQQGGVPAQLAAAQQATITGGSTIGNVTAWNRVPSSSQADQASAMNMVMQNNFLSTINPQSKNFNNLRGFMSATEQLGNIGASGAAGFLNDLTSNQATQFFSQRSAGLGGPLNPRTNTLRSPQQALLTTLEAAAPNLRGLSGSKLSSALKSISGSDQWAVLSQNLQQGAGLSSSDMVALHEFAAQGGNLGKATGGPVSKTAAQALLAQTTQSTATKNQLMQETTGVQVAMAKLKTTVSHLEATLAGWVTNLVHGNMGGIGGSVAGLAAHIPVVGGVASSVIQGVSSLLPFGDPTSTSGMQPNLAHGITAMKAANPNIQINSGYRTASQQAALYAAKGGQGVARPGQSPHQLGKAADIGPPSQFAWIAANAPKFGLASDRNEPWHIQALGDPNTGSTVTGAQIVSAASSQLGANYVWGGESAGSGSKPGAFDCSGLVQYVFKQVGINLPRTSQQQATAGTPVNGLNNAQAGDIILYNEPGEGPNSHVAIYIGGGKQIAAPHTGTVVQVQPVDTSHISTIRRIVGGGAGGKVVAAAQGTVGQSSNDSSNHSGAGAAVSAGSPGGLSNNFLTGVSGSWLGGGGPGVGGGTASGPAAGGTSGTSGSTTTASTGSTALVGGGGGAINSPTGFSKAVLSGLGFPATNADVTSLNAWQQMEGQWAAGGIYNAMQMHDPLNTKLPEPGYKSLGGLTNSYPNWAEGVAATVSTIKQGNMSAIYNALKANDSLASFGQAAESTPWAQSAYGGKSWPAPTGTYAVGDPTSGFQPNLPGQSYGGAGPVTTMGSGTGRGLSVSVGPIYVTGTQSDANNIANMVASAIKGHKEIQAVARS